MNNKGFTLIELLAVILILSLLALLANTSVTKVVRDSKADLYNSQIKMIEMAAETWGSDNIDKLPDKGECKYLTLGDLKKYGLLDSSIKNPKTNKEFSDDLNIKISANENVHGKINITYEFDSGDVSGCEDIYYYKTYLDGEIVYFDVESGASCTNYNEENSKNNYNGIDNKMGNQNSCLKFYAFLDTGEETLNLLLDHNTTSSVAWNSSGITTNGPKEALEELKKDTDSWKGTLTPDNYYVTQTNSGNYTIDYNTYKARLITANEIVKIIGITDWNELTSNSSTIYLASGTSTANENCIEGNTTGCKYTWLYDRMHVNGINWGAPNNADVTTYGYWTATSAAEKTSSAWRLGYVANLIGGDKVSSSNGRGIRPVIKVYKTKLINE